MEKTWPIKLIGSARGRFGEGQPSPKRKKKMADSIIQFNVALLGLASIYCAMHTRAAVRRFAPILGLIGQPFWFYVTITAGQWGMVALCAAYTVVYVRTLWVAA